MVARLVTPAKAGAQLTAAAGRSGFPAFAGVTALLMFLFFALALPAAAQTFPKPTGRVVDQADLLRPEQELDLRSKSAALEAQSGAQLVVVTVNGLEGRRIEDYSYQLGRAWGIGEEKKDNGVLLVVAPKERKVWISTGYGARVKLTDAVASVIYRDAIIPRFRRGDYAGGISAGVDQIVEVMSLSPAEAARQAGQARQQEQQRATSGGGFMPVLFLLIIFFVFIRSMARRAGGRRYRRRRGGISPMVMLWGLDALSHSGRRGGWGGGGGFGGFGGGGGGFGGFSGGGGSFGGGGAGGSW